MFGNEDALCYSCYMLSVFWVSNSLRCVPLNDVCAVQTDNTSSLMIGSQSRPVGVALKLPHR